MIMFADNDGRGPMKVPDPDPTAERGISRELLDECEDGARRAERLARLLAAEPPAAIHADVTNRLAWAILALEDGSDAEDAA